MSERDQFRAALTTAIDEAGRGATSDPTCLADPADLADAVLAVLDQQGRVSPEAVNEAVNAALRKHNKALAAAPTAQTVDQDEIAYLRGELSDSNAECATWHDAMLTAEAERDAALREAARYERLGEVASDQHGLPYAQWDDVEVPFGVPLYRRVTTDEGGE